jgi:hypothetical protein
VTARVREVCQIRKSLIFYTVNGVSADLIGDESQTCETMGLWVDVWRPFHLRQVAWLEVQNPCGQC